MSTLFRPGAIEPFSRAAFGKSNPNPLKIKHAANLLIKNGPTMTSESMKYRSNGIFSGNPKGVTGMTTGSCVRLYHTDVKFPNMEDYRQNSTKDVTKRMEETEEARKMVHYLSYGVGGIISMYAAKTIVVDLVEYKSPPRSQLALAAIEVNLADIPEGKSATFMWRGKPCFVRHRSQEQIEKERSVTVSDLRDPQKDEDRVIKPDWLVVIGVCTHLGCVPLANLGEFGGYYCPCHGSHYDTSGRIRKGPAPANLEVPYHEFTEDGRLIIGKA